MKKPKLLSSFLFLSLLLPCIWLSICSCTKDVDKPETTTPEVELDDDELSTDNNLDFEMPTNWGSEPNLEALTKYAADYGVVANTGLNQTSKIQAALDDLESLGGGNLILSEGEYHIAGVYMRSNVHILVSKDAIIKPYYVSKGYQVNIHLFEFTRALESKETDESDFVENCGISCLEGDGSQYTIDYSSFFGDIENNVDIYSITYSNNYSDLKSDLYENGGMCFIRFIRARRIRNFLIADANIIDNYTTCCGISFGGAGVADMLDVWEVAQPTNGVIRNCDITNASHGYGLAQTHSGKNLYFEDVSAKGGVTLRIEPHNGENVRVENIYGHNIHNEYGKCAVLFQPHSTHHGLVVVDNVTCNSSSFGVLIREGFIGSSSSGTEIGTFDENSRINNVKVTYGTKAQIEEKDAWIYPNALTYSADGTIAKVLKSRCETAIDGDETIMEKYRNYYQYEAPSFAPIFSDAVEYKITMTNVTYEGDGFNTDFFNTAISSDGVIYTATLNTKFSMTSKDYSAFYGNSRLSCFINQNHSSNYN